MIWAARLLPLIAFLAHPPLATSLKHNGEKSCLLPERWQGAWFQSGVRQAINIQASRFSTKGRCLASDGDKFLIVDDKGTCYRCVVIHEKHENVLQYKETYCTPRPESLYSLCAHITGDALLYSMFRQNAVPVTCPFSGYHIFSYNRGHGECKTPLSTMESCTQDSRLILSYQACPDVEGSESAVEELQCLAIWKEGSSWYLVGKMEHGHISSNEDRYRCFVYEKASLSSPSPSSDIVYRVAQSGDATCNGLFSPMEGSRTMTLHRGTSPTKCKFPSWLTWSHWHGLDMRTTYSFHHRNTSLKVSETEGRAEDTKIQCAEVRRDTLDTALILGHYTLGCKSGYVCMMFYKRDTHVIELQSGTYARSTDEACSLAYFDKSKLPFVTLVSSTPEQEACPQSGRFSVAGEGRSQSKRAVSDSVVAGQLAGAPGTTCSIDSLAVGCSQPDTMEFRSTCNHASVLSGYTCHASWTEDGTSYLITTPVSRSSHSARRYCFAFRAATPVASSPVAPPTVYHYSSSGETCSRAVVPGVSGVIVFNITSTGSCTELSAGSLFSANSLLLFFFLLILYVCTQTR